MAMPGRGGILTCHIENIEMLYALPNSSERLPMNGKVVWINAKTQGGRPAGFAVQIGTDIAGQRIKNEVERLLAGKIDGLQSTYTM